jgi:hypothetical protein
LILSLGSLGCDRLWKSHKTVDVTPITTEEASLQKTESDLLGQRGVLQRERKKLSDARAEIIDRRKQLGHDSAGQAALDSEEQKLLAQESALSQKESDVNGKLDALLAERDRLVVRATQAVAGAPSADPLERAARREKDVATRERELAEREKDVATRERELGEREARELKRERETCSAPQTVQLEIPKGLKYSAHDVEPIYRKALKRMQERGLLAPDLPPSSARLVDEVREAMKKGDYVRAKYDADSLLATVEGIRIDRTFISAKMARLAQAMHGHKLASAERKTIEGLFQDATANYGDGKFPQANGKINRLFALLK